MAKINLDTDQLRILLNIFAPGLACPEPVPMNFSFQGEITRQLSRTPLGQQEVWVITKERELWGLITQHVPGSAPRSKMEFRPTISPPQILRLQSTATDTLKDIVVRERRQTSISYVLFVVRDGDQCTITAYQSPDGAFWTEK